jgi:hypothetical protein
MSRTGKVVIAGIVLAAAAGPARAGTLSGDCAGWQVTGTSGFSYNYQINVSASLVDADTNGVVSTSSGNSGPQPGGPPADTWLVSNTWPDPIPTGNYIITAVEQVQNLNTGNIVLTFDHVFPTEGGKLACLGGGEGCTPGYWKQPHHFDDWPAGYDPATPFSDVFEDAFAGKSLLDVLAQPASAPPGPEELNSLGRHTVAALLNSASDDVSYSILTSQVISLFNDAYPGTADDYEELKDTFQDQNEAGCPLSGGADANGDGLVNLHDLISVINHWGTNDVFFDVTHNGNVDVGDVIHLFNWWGI